MTDGPAAGGPVTDIRVLDVGEDDTAAAVIALQRIGYAVEARLLGFEGIPQLHESPADLRAAGESWLGSFDADGLAGTVSWRRLDNGTLDICRLVVAPRAHRRGHATALLDALDRREPADVTVVSTGAGNGPALALYRSRGFVPVGTRDVGVLVTLLERHTAPTPPATGR